MPQIRNILDQLEQEKSHLFWRIFYSIYFLGIVFSGVYYLLGMAELSERLILSLFLAFPVIFSLEKYKYHTMARLGLVFSCGIHIHIMSTVETLNGNAHMYTIPLLTLGFVFFDRSQKWALIITSAIVIKSWVFAYLMPRLNLPANSVQGNSYFSGLEVFEYLAVFIASAVFLTLFINSNERRRKIKVASLHLAKEELHRAHNQLERFFHLSGSVLVIVDALGRLKKSNGVIESTLGYTFEELNQMPFWEYTHPDDRGSAIMAFEKVNSGSAVINFESRLIAKDKSVHYFIWSATVNTITQEVYSMGQVVTASRNSEREKMQLLRAIEDSAIVTTTDIKGKILTVNEMFCRLSGYSSEELIGQDHRLLNSGAHSKSFFKDMWATISSGRVWYGEIENRAKNGQLYYVSTVITPITNDQGVIQKYMAVRFDRTKEHALHLDLEKERAKVVHANKLSSLGEMATGMAHEINNPLAIILGITQLLKRQIPQEQESFANLLKIEKASNRIAKIIDVVRQYSKSDRNERKIIDVSNLIEDALILVKGKADMAGVPISLELSSDLQVMGDSNELQQAISSLLSNGIDASSHFVERWVKIVTYAHGNDVIVRVIDSGRGIPPEIQEKLFLPFFTTKQTAKGTGLGLTITKAILDRHQANIRVALVDGHTCFEIAMPRQQQLSVAS